MKIWFTADCHFDHENIIKFCNRPFKNVNHMNEEIIRRWNNKVSSEDVVYHIGDFAFKGMDNAIRFESKLNGNIVHIRGNHDKNNGVKTYNTKAIMEFGGLVFYVTHIPPVENQIGTIESNLISICDFILCAHVHNLWKWKRIDNKIAINVGVDVWNFEPINIHSILKLISRIKKGIEA